ncbi:MAG: UDP-N-acetylglucosamine 2-epimerase [Gammaproteobacteria bacterium]
MIVCVIGTRAQLIKMAPVLVALERAGLGYTLILTGQHRATMFELLAEFGIATVPITLHEGAEITGITQMGLWSLKVLWRALVSRRAIFPAARRGERAAMLVHGDTLSTLLGALIGKLRAYDVLHVESGLTSGTLREPFPEEITRRMVFRLADVAFCPGTWAASNLAGRRLRIVDTGSNTLRDAVRVALARPRTGVSPPAGPSYAVVSIHRFENIFKRERFEFIVECLEAIGERIAIVFVLHPATRKQAERFALLERLESHPAICIYPRMTYVPFMQIIAASRFVITDGGSNQEELSYLGIPTLIMRGATERQEGLGATAVLSRYDRATIDSFVDRALSGAASPPRTLPEDDASPSAIIVDELAASYAKSGTISVP